MHQFDVQIDIDLFMRPRILVAAALAYIRAARVPSKRPAATATAGHPDAVCHPRSVFTVE